MHPQFRDREPEAQEVRCPVRGLTMPASPFPVAMSTICMAISLPQRLCASRVLAPRCGQQMTLGWFTRSRSLGGSC